MERDKRTMSFQFASDGKRKNQVDKRPAAKKKVETDWVFPEPDYAIKEQEPKHIEEKVEQGEMEREIRFWNESKVEVQTEIPKEKNKRKAMIEFPQLNIPWMLITATASAIVIGVSLGVSMLSFFPGIKDQPTLQPAIEVGASIVSEEEQSSSAFQLFVIQAGAFSTEAAAGTVIDQIKNEGFAAVMEEGQDTNYLYVGTGASKDQAEQMAGFYKDEGFDVYVKEYEVPPLSDENQSEAIQWMNLAGENLMEIVEVTADPTIIEEDQRKTITEKLTKLEGMREASMESESEVAKATAQTLIAKMAETNNLLNEEDASSSSMQQLNLEALLAYKKGIDQFEQ